MVNLARRDAAFTVDLKDKPMKNSRRFTLLMAVIALVLYASSSARSDELKIQEEPIPAQPNSESQIPRDQSSDEEWQMEIEPAVKLSAAPSGTMEVRSGTTDAGQAMTFDRAEYARIYNSIPFNRTEFDANPNYRHDSTMEILTGNSRHQTIVQHNFEHKQPVKRIPAPTRPSRILVPFNLPYLPFGSSFGSGFGLPGLRF
jgi:hypothetical protein